MTRTRWMDREIGLNPSDGLLGHTPIGRIAPNAPTIQLIRSNSPLIGEGAVGWPQEAVAQKRSEATMAALAILAMVMALFGIAMGAFLMLSFAISREDRKKWSLRIDPPSSAKRAARAMVGVSSSRWD